MFENDHLQNCVYFRCFFLVLKPQCTAKWHVFYIRNGHISVSSFVYKGRWLTQAGYWFILRFGEHFTCLSSKIQNAIKLENISNLITSPSSYQCRKTRLVHFVIHGRHISMECMCAFWGSPNVNFQNKW